MVWLSSYTGPSRDQPAIPPYHHTRSTAPPKNVLLQNTRPDCYPNNDWRDDQEQEARQRSEGLRSGYGAPGLNLPTRISDGNNPLESFLLHHFHAHVSGAVSKGYHDLLLDVGHHAQLKSAVLALSASNIFQLHLFQRGTRSGLCTRRSRDGNANIYYRRAITFYGKALQFLRGAGEYDQISPHLKLAAALLLALFEWECGSVKAYFVHLNGADVVALSYHRQLSQTVSGSRLLCLWAEMRSQKNSRLLPFRPMEVEVADGQQMQAADLAQQYLVSFNSVSGLLAEAYNLRNRLVLLTCTAPQWTDPAAVLRASSEWYSTRFNYSYVDEVRTAGCQILSRSEILEHLASTYQSLQAWHASLTDLEKPTSADVPFATAAACTLGTALQIKPLVFRESRAAVRYLHYAIGSVLSSNTILDNFLFREPPAPLGGSLPAEALLVLSILEGLDSHTMLASGVSDRGSMWTMVALVLCVPDIRITTHLIEKVIPRLESAVSCGPILCDLVKLKRDVYFAHSQIRAGYLMMLCDANELITADCSLRDDARFGHRAACLGRDIQGRVFRKFLKLPVEDLYSSDT